MTVLSVNLNKIALLRNSRGHDYPNIQHFARQAIAAGAQGITIHPRPDQRHATYQDVVDLAALCQSMPEVELNIEGYPNKEFLDVVVAAKPDQCTLVPDEPGQLTSDHGWQIAPNHNMLSDIIQRLHTANIRTSLFMDPDPAQITQLKDLGTDRIELYTEQYARDFNTAQAEATWQQYQAAAQAAQALNLGVNAGHDLNLQNLADFLRIAGVLEVSIGHALTIESLEQGFSHVVAQYAAICEK